MHCRNAEIEAQIAQLRAALLHKEQEHDRMQLQLAQEKEEREKVQRKVRDAVCSAYPKFRREEGFWSQNFVVMMSGAAQHKRMQGTVTGSADTSKLFKSSGWW